MRFIIFCFTLLFSLQCYSQSPTTEKFTISGAVKDASNGEELIGATVTLKDNPGIGVVTNAYGFYSLTLPKGKHVLIYRYIGFVDQEQEIILDKSTVLNMSLSTSQKELKQVEIVAGKKDNLKKAEMGVTKLDMKELEKIPVIFGERDVIKTLQLLPGVKSAGEGSTGIFVRGGGADQNLILLDEAPVYNASHLLGFFSTFNTDAIKDVTLYKGNMPAEYGGRLSSTIDIKMKEGNDKRFVVGGGLGIIASRLSIEGPIVKDKGSFIITGRRTYADIFLKALPASNPARNSTLYFYDINAKANYRIGKKDRIFISGYFGRDKFGITNNNNGITTSFGIDYGNITGTLRWNHIFSEKLFSNTSLIVSNFDYNIGISALAVNIDIKSNVLDYNLKQDFQYYRDNKNTLKFGFLSIMHTIQPGNVSSRDTSRVNAISLSKKYGWENAIYFQHEWKPTSKVEVNYGLRLSSFSVTGPSKNYTFDRDGKLKDSTYLKLGQFGKTYFNLEPRIAISYNFLPNHSFKTSYSRNTQNVNQLSNSQVGSPTDVWVLTSNNIKPGISDQVALGYYLNFWKDRFEFSIEGYYKHLWNQIDYRNGAVLRANETIESQLVYGTGRAYGAEFFLRKKTGKLTGWISYTLSKTERTFDDIENGRYFPARQDRTHDLSVVLIYQIIPRLSVSTSFIYYTGDAVTFPSGKYVVNGSILNYYTERNGYRTPAYHRLDIGLNYDFKTKKNFEHGINFSVYNLYAQKNPFSFSFQPSDEDPRKVEIVKTYLFRIVPSLTYNFKFTAPEIIKKKK